MRLVGIIIL